MLWDAAAWAAAFCALILLAVFFAAAVRRRAPAGAARAEDFSDVAAALQVDPAQLAGIQPAVAAALRKHVVRDSETSLLRREVGVILLEALLCDAATDGGAAGVVAIAVEVPDDATRTRAPAELAALHANLRDWKGPALRLSQSRAVFAAQIPVTGEPDARVLQLADRLGARTVSLRPRPGEDAAALLKRLEAALDRRPLKDVAAGVLSKREQEVARLIAAGLSNRQIARQLYLSPDTVSSHVKHILAKLGYASRSQVAAYWALRAGAAAGVRSRAEAGAHDAANPARTA